MLILQKDLEQEMKTPTHSPNKNKYLVKIYRSSNIMKMISNNIISIYRSDLISVKCWTTTAGLKYLLAVAKEVLKMISL